MYISQQEHITIAEYILWTFTGVSALSFAISFCDTTFGDDIYPYGVESLSLKMNNVT